MVKLELDAHDEVLVALKADEGTTMETFVVSYEPTGIVVRVHKPGAKFPEVIYARSTRDVGDNEDCVVISGLEEDLDDDGSGTWYTVHVDDSSAAYP